MVLGGAKEKLGVVRLDIECRRGGSLLKTDLDLLIFVAGIYEKVSYEGGGLHGGRGQWS